MGLKKIKEGCWVDEDNPYFSLNEWFHVVQNLVIYYVTNGHGFVEFKRESPVPEEELYEKIFVPGQKAVSAIFN